VTGNNAEFLDIDNNVHEAVYEILINLQQVTSRENVD
jgi:hypothetical protein